jgi:hypothetical protein
MRRGHGQHTGAWESLHPALYRESETGFALALQKECREDTLTELQRIDQPEIKALSQERLIKRENSPARKSAAKTALT